MRRALAAALAVAGLALAGCGSDNSGDEATSVSIPAVTAPSYTAPSTTSSTPTVSTSRGTTTSKSGGVDPNAPDSETNDVPPPPGSPQEAFEKQCEANPAACAD